MCHDGRALTAHLPEHSSSANRKSRRSTSALLLGSGLFLACGSLLAWDGLVEKQVFEMERYVTEGGEEIPALRVGWEAYGTLNEARDNVILITHFFSGTSHAAGRYAEDDAAPGYWDAIIGPGKPLDTDTYYIIASDTLVNLNAHDPNVITMGPASIRPDTGEPWGMDFPVVTIGDFVNVQKALLESLGIERLHAVMGASMGALQALEWASSHPHMVERVIPVVGAGMVDAYLIGWLDAWAAPIRLDPNWNGGDYYGGEPPLAGLKASLKLVTLQANHWKWANRTFGREWADEAADPARDMQARYLVEATLDELAEDRARVADANHLLYLVRANQATAIGPEATLEASLARIEAPTLMIYSEDDLVFFPEAVRETARLIAAGGAEVEEVTLQGERGHFDGVLSMEQAGEPLRAFLAR